MLKQHLQRSWYVFLVRGNFKVVFQLALVGLLSFQIFTGFTNERINDIELRQVTDFSISNYAKETQDGYFPTVTLNKAHFHASLGNVSGLIPGKRDKSNRLFSQSNFSNNDPPLVIQSKPIANSDEEVYEATYSCKFEEKCKLTIFINESSNDRFAHRNENLLLGYHILGTNEYFIMNPSVRRTSE